MHHSPNLSPLASAVTGPAGISSPEKAAEGPAYLPPGRIRPCSIPFVTAYVGLFPDAEIVITGVEDPGTQAHGSSESLHLATFERACLAEALLLRNLATSG
jgi:hypothetical protein